MIHGQLENVSFTFFQEIPFYNKVEEKIKSDFELKHSVFRSVCLEFCWFVFSFFFPLGFVFFSSLQYDFMERLDGKEKWSVVESPRERRSIQTLVQNEAVFVQYLDVGLWHLAFYNDGKDKEVVSFSTVILGRYCHKLGIFLFCLYPPLPKVVIFFLHSSVFGLFVFMLCIFFSQHYSGKESVMGCADFNSLISLNILAFP